MCACACVCVCVCRNKTLIAIKSVRPIILKFSISRVCVNKNLIAIKSVRPIIFSNSFVCLWICLFLLDCFVEVSLYFWLPITKSMFTYNYFA